MEKINYLNLPLFEVYNAVLKGDIKRFPNNYINKEKARQLVRYNILKKFDIPEDYLEKEEEMERLRKSVISMKWLPFMQEVRLGAIFDLFDNSPFKLISYCFSELEIYNFELARLSPNYWDKDENRLDALMWVAKKENINLDDISDVKRRLIHTDSYKFISRKGAVFKGKDGIYRFLNLYYKDRYKPWQLPSKNYRWSLRKGILATRWLIDEVYGWTKEEVCQNISSKIFEKNDLSSMLRKVFKNSPILALNAAYPKMNYTKEEIRSYSINRFKKD